MAIVTLRTVCIVIIAIWQKLIDRLCPWLLGSHTPQYLLLNGYCKRRFALFSAVQRVRVALLRLPCVDKFQLLHVNNRYRPSRAKFTSKNLVAAIEPRENDWPPTASPTSTPVSPSA